MKGMKHTLALAAALALSLSAVANADDHRGRGYRDNDRPKHAAPQRGNSKFRAQRRTIKRDVKRPKNRHGHYRDGRQHRDNDRRFDRRHAKHWRGGKQARRHWRQHRRARKHWRAQQRHDYRAARRHRHGDHICYTNHRYQRSTFGIWLDDIGFTVAERRYR